MKRSLLSVLLLAGCISQAYGQAAAVDQNAGLLGGGCRNPPAINPNEDFLGNFNNSCYALTLSASRGANHAGDLNARYGLAYYKVTPGYELVLTGTFPNARFFSVTVYDSHLVQTSGALDYAIAPLTNSVINPYVPNTPFRANQQYGLTIGFGGAVPVSVTPGCSTSDTTIDENFLDASQIHQGLSWNGYPDLPQGFPIHLTGANGGGQIIVRSYDDLSAEPQPNVIVRDLSTGCAVPIKDAGGIITTNLNVGGPWADESQISGHKDFSYSIEQDQCFPQDPINQVRWNRSTDYVPGDNNAAAYLGFDLSSSKVKSLISGKEFIMMRFQLPQTPDTPCLTGTCSLTGSEQLRYRSISFQNGQKTLASYMDPNYVRDPNGNVTLVIGLGTKPPAYVTAANYYTYFDLSKVLGYRNLDGVTMRDILPNISFDCSSANVPHFFTEYNPEGGYMGNYVPTVDFVTADQIPQTPVPVNRANTCAIVPTQVPVACGAH